MVGWGWGDRFDAEGRLEQGRGAGSELRKDKTDAEPTTVFSDSDKLSVGNRSTLPRCLGCCI